MKTLTLAAALALAFVATAASAQNATGSLSVVPGMNGESSGTVTGVGPERAGAFGTPPDIPDVGAARGSTRSHAKGAGSAQGSAGAGRGTGTGTKKRSTVPAIVDPF
ncbi:MAG TPA: hypothetical protein VHP37_25890 [Burkholderiales bacterium]|nr:hypothetical protein [Burkholderiales bacterium]